MNNIFKEKYLLKISVLLTAQLIFLYVVKYLNQELPLTCFSLLKNGNILNLLLYSGIIAGILISYSKGKTSILKQSINTYLFISWAMLIIAFISTKIHVVSPKIYIYEHPGDKVLTGFLFFLFLFSLVYFLTYIWSKILSNKKPTMVKNLFRALLLILVFLLIILIYNDNIGYASKRWSLTKSKSNIAVVLGAAVWSGNVPSPTLSSRVDKGLELLDQGFIGKIIFTGGSAPGELPEAEVAFAYAKVKGIDTSKVIIENLTANTAEQMKWIKNNLPERADSIDDIIIVSDAYHLPRVIEISKFFELDIKVAESVLKQNAADKLYTKIREAIALFIFWNFAL